MNYVIIGLVIALAVLGLHDRSMSSQRDKYMKESVTLQTSLDQEKSVAKTCSDATKEVAAKTEEKTEKIKKKIEKAKVSADTNNKNADNILTGKVDPALSVLEQVDNELNKFIDLRTKENEETKNANINK